MPAPSASGRPDPTPPARGPVARRRDPATLAAILVAAMPQVRPVAVAPARAGGEDVDAALVHDEDSGVWVVLAPRTLEAAARVEAETEAVRLLAGVLPFDVPRPRADVPLPGGGRAVVFPAPRGRPVDLVRLAASPGVCRSVGRTLAALHDVTTAVVERAGVPVRDAGEVRRRRLLELDQGAATGQVPPVLLERWESLLDDTSVWDFSPTVVHGDLVAERLVVTGEEVTAVLDWNDLHVGDPAQDLAWLAVGAEPETVAEVLAAYRSSRHGSVDGDLLRRAVLHGEMALVRWLLHGVAAADTEVQHDARGMLEQLAGWVEGENAARRAELAAEDEDHELEDEHDHEHDDRHEDELDELDELDEQDEHGDDARDPRHEADARDGDDIERDDAKPDDVDDVPDERAGVDERAEPVRPDHAADEDETGPPTTGPADGPARTGSTVAGGTGARATDAEPGEGGTVERR